MKHPPTFQAPAQARNLDQNHLSQQQLQNNNTTTTTNTRTIESRTMGKPPAATNTAGSSSQSVHSLQLLDHDNTDLLITEDDNFEDPPSYDAAINDAEPSTQSTANDRIHSSLSLPTARLIDADYRPIGGRRARSVRSSVRNTHIVTLHPDYTAFAGELAQLMAQQVRLPPRPQIVIYGTHTETSINHKDNKKQTNTVTDFQFRLDLAETLLTGWETATEQVLPESTWYRASVSWDYDGRKTYRGTRMKSLVWKGPKATPNTSHSVTPDQNTSYRDDEESNPPVDEEQGRLIQGNRNPLLEWCQRYCNDPSSIKSCVHSYLLSSSPIRKFRLTFYFTDLP